MVPSDRRRGNGLKMGHGRFHVNVKKNLFTFSIMEPWNGLPGEFMVSPSLEMFKTHLDVSFAIYCREPALVVGVD